MDGSMQLGPASKGVAAQDGLENLRLGEFFKLRTHHRTIIVEKRQSGAIVSVPDKDVDADTPALFAYVPNQKRNACFLISRHGTELVVKPNVRARGVLPLGLGRGTDDVVSLYDPCSGVWLCGTPPHNGVGDLVVARHRIDAFERFTLVTTGELFLPKEIADTAQRLDRILSINFDVTLLDQVAASDGPLIEACFRLLAPHLQRSFAEALANSPKLARRVADMFPNDPLGRFGIAELSEWITARNGTPSAGPVPRHTRFHLPWRRSRSIALAETPPAPNGPRNLDTAFDSLASIGFDGSYVSLPHAVTVLARQAVRPSKRLCIVATARNEGVYLLEWIAYHRAIGVEQFFLYTNDTDDGSDDLLAALSAAGEISWNKSSLGPKGNAQQKAYGHAFASNADLLDYQWTLTIDLDEYLAYNPGLFGSALDLLDWFDTKNAEAVALNWVVKGSSGQARWRDTFIADRFPSAPQGPGRHIKTLCHSNAFVHSTPHFPRRYRDKPFVFCAADGHQHLPAGSSGGLAHSANPNADFAWINHYFFKSAEEYLWKWSRNRGDHTLISGPSTSALTADFVKSFMQQFGSTDRQSADLRECAPGLDNELRRLRELPGVADVQTRIVKQFRARMEIIIPMFAQADGIRMAGEVGQEFMSLLSNTLLETQEPV